MTTIAAGLADFERSQVVVIEATEREWSGVERKWWARVMGVVGVRKEGEWYSLGDNDRGEDSGDSEGLHCDKEGEVGGCFCLLRVEEGSVGGESRRFEVDERKKVGRKRESCRFIDERGGGEWMGEWIGGVDGRLDAHVREGGQD